MSDAPGTKEEDGPHEGPIKTPRQLIIAVLFSFVVPVVVILLLATFVESATRPAAGSDNLAAKAVAARTAPIGQAQVQEAPVVAAASESAASEAASAPLGDPAAMAAALAQVQAAKAASAAGGGEVTTVASAGTAPALYNNVCQACHSMGVAGAPKFGDKAAWAPRIPAGIDGLTASAIKGKGAMPPRGGSQATVAEIKDVVTYMVGAAK